MGRYFDEQSVVVYDEQAIPFFGLFFAISLIALTMMCRRTLKTIRGSKAKDNYTFGK